MDISRRRGIQGPKERPAKGRGQRLGQRSVRAGRALSGAVHLLTGGQLTEPFCHVPDTSPRGTAAVAAEVGTRLVTLGKGKPTCFQLSLNQPPDYDGNKSVSAVTPAPGKEAAGGCLCSSSQLARVCEHSQDLPTLPPSRSWDLTYPLAALSSLVSPARGRGA